MVKQVKIKNFPLEFICKSCKKEHIAKDLAKTALKNKIRILSDMKLFSSQVLCNDDCETKWYFYIKYDDEIHMEYLGDQTKIRSDYYDSKNLKSLRRQLLYKGVVGMKHLGIYGYDGISLETQKYLRYDTGIPSDHYTDIEEYIANTPIFIFRRGKKEFLCFGYHRGGDMETLSLRTVNLGFIPEMGSPEFNAINGWTNAVNYLTLFGILPVEDLILTIVDIDAQSKEVAKY